jgi:hypothetical protein
MALNTDQKASKLFKKLQGMAETTILKQFFEEAYLGRSSIFHDKQIWNQSDLIPDTAPTLTDGQIDGVVQYFEDLVLNAIPGLNNSFYHDDLKDAIPFNYGDGSYNYFLKDSSNNQIPFGMGDWIVDTEAGVLTFYSSVPANMPPVISFYKYVGTKGAGGVGPGTVIGWETEFTNADLASGMITFNHNISAQYNVVHISIKDNSNNDITPDDIKYISPMSATIDLSSFGNIIGTWSVLITGISGTPVPPQQNSKNKQLNGFVLNSIGIN